MDYEITRKKYEALVKKLVKENISISTMESMTGGQLASLITDTSNASKILKGAYVTYSNEAKIACGVDARIIEQFGVYSQMTARSMAKACAKAYGAMIGIGVTGTTGNVDPKNSDSHIGQIFYAISYKKEIYDGYMELSAQQKRLDYKMLVADEICDKIFEIIE